MEVTRSEKFTWSTKEPEKASFANPTPYRGLLYLGRPVEDWDRLTILDAIYQSRRELQHMLSILKDFQDTGGVLPITVGDATNKRNT